MKPVRIRSVLELQAKRSFFNYIDKTRAEVGKVGLEMSTVSRFFPLKVKISSEMSIKGW